jgi:hypothetical protein
MKIAAAFLIDIQVTSDSMKCYTADDGVTYLKVSPGGKMSNINGTFATFKTNPKRRWTAFRDNTMHHFANLRVTPDALTVEIYDVKGDGSPPVIQEKLTYTDACPKE